MNHKLKEVKLMSKEKIKNGQDNKQFKQKIDGKTLNRLISYIKKYKIQLIIVFICIIINTVATVFGSVFIKTLIDSYITPLIGIENPNFSGLLQGITLMIVVDIIGVITGYFYNRIMAVVSQSVQRDIRDEMF